MKNNNSKPKKIVSFVLSIAIAFSVCFIVQPNLSGGKAAAVSISSGSIYKITSVRSGKVLSVQNSSLSDRGNIHQWTDTGSDSQRWIITSTGDGYYTVTSVASGLVMDVDNSANTNATNVQQYTSNSSNAQKWQIVDNGDGACRLIPKCAPGLSLDQGGSTEEGWNVQIWADNSSDGQKWMLEVQSAQDKAPTDAIANSSMTSFLNRYYVLNGSNGSFSGEGFWGAAEIFEIVIDAYNRTGSSYYKNLIYQVYNGFVAAYGTNWSSNMYNDDIMWMVLGCARAYLATGDTNFKTQAKNHFDIVYSRAYSSALGGGLWWTTDNNTKNSCINGPAVIGACLISRITGDTSYMNKAVSIYNWQRANLYEPATGKVYDAYSIDGSKNTWSSTYNQGTFIGAATLLYKYYGTSGYLNDAVAAANYTMNNMYSGGVINNEESGGDLPGFKGILARWLRELIVDCNQTQYISWFQKNAAVAWNNRNTQGLTSTQWANKTSETATYTAFNCSTAVSLLQNCPQSAIVAKNAFSTIQIEDFDEIRGSITEGSVDGTLNIGGVVNGHYTLYRNVDFGSSGAVTFTVRASAAVNGGTIEIRQGNESGTLLGTCTVTGTGNWETYRDFSCNITRTTGVKDICLVYKGSSYLFNINWFKFQ